MTDNHAACPNHPGYSYNKSTGDCCCGSNHHRWASSNNPGGLARPVNTEDWTVWIDGRHCVDVGNVFVDETHRTRDGFPMEVRHKSELGYLVAVCADRSAQIKEGV